MRFKILVAVFALTIAGIFAYLPRTTDTEAYYIPTAKTVRERVFLREKWYGRANDEIDGLISKKRAEIAENEPKWVSLGLYWITGYDLCVHCCGIWSAEHPSRQGTDYVQTTASGVPNQVGVTVAAGKEFKFGTVIYIDGIGERIVQDRGVGNGCVDVLCHNHSECAEVTGWRKVWVRK